MTVLDEERCRELVGKLCSGLGWSVRERADIRYVLLNRAGGWITFGQSMTKIVMSLCEQPPSYAIPKWILECSSPEELALKAEVAL